MDFEDHNKKLQNIVSILELNTSYLTQYIQTLITRIQLLERENICEFHMQSTELTVSSSNNGDGNETQQTTTFEMTGSDGEVYYQPATHLGEILNDAVTQATLKDFLARPVRIVAGTWAESSTYGSTLTTFSPWNLFFNETRIKNKLHNFAFMRCNLKIKVVLNASPFYYGRALMHYRPLPTFKTTVPLVTTAKEMIPYSQRPKIWWRPEDNAGGEMTLPFLWPKNWVTLRNASDLTALGQMSVMVYSQLQSANAVVGTGVPYTIYAWAEDIVLSGSTLSLAMQSSETVVDNKDEYITGKVSGPATALANIADRFVPTFGPYATATSMALRTTAAIARMFGYTNVPVVDATRPMRINQFANFASTEVGYPLEKLTIDTKNELSVDPRILGLAPKDELEVKSLVTRDSFLVTTTWTSSLPLNSILFYSNITPRLQDNVTIDGSTQAIYHTPMSYIAAAFTAWRGDIIFDFDFVASQYHKGRVQIAFDPIGDTTNNVVNTNDVTSAVYTVIVDLAKERTTSIRIPYQQALGWLSTQSSSVTPVVWSTAGAPTFVRDETLYNGALCMKVLNPLTGPTLTTAIDIIIKVRGADNLEFANPAPFRSNLSFFRPQSQEVIVQETVGSSQPSLSEKRGLINYGEVIRSLRPLIRRTTYATPVNFNVSASSGYTILEFGHYKIPPFPGYDPNGLYDVGSVIGGIGTKKYNWGNMSLLQYLMPSFVAYRGSVFWYYNPHGMTSMANNLNVVRVPSAGLPNAYILASTALGATASARALIQMKEQTSSGVSLCNPRIAAGTGIAVPMQSQYLMHSTDMGNATVAASADDSSKDAVRVEISDSAAFIPITSATQAPAIDTYSGAGTDFNLYFFLNVPTLYYNPTIPTPL